MELISVIIPVFNSKEYLSRCIDSILCQTYENLEIILVNDGSNDGSGIVCDEYAAAHPNIKTYHQENLGVSAARNLGIGFATGDYLSFIDSDDEIAKYYFELLYKTLKMTNSDISICGTVVVYDNDRSKKLQAGELKVDYDQIKLMTGIQAVESMLYQKKIGSEPFAKLFRKELFINVRFRKELVIAEDLQINYELFVKADQVASSCIAAYLYRQRVGSAMRKRFRVERMGSLDVLNRLLDEVHGESNRLVSSIKNRVFMESLLIAADIKLNQKDHSDMLMICLGLIKTMRYRVLTDNASRLRMRVYAAISLVSPRLLVELFTLKSKINNKRLISREAGL